MRDKQLMPLSLRLSKDLYARLDDFCEKYYIERPQAVRLALRVFFEAYEKQGGLLTDLFSAENNNRLGETNDGMLKNSLSYKVENTAMPKVAENSRGAETPLQPNYDKNN